MVEAPAGATGGASGGGGGGVGGGGAGRPEEEERKLRFEAATKRYFLHYCCQSDGDGDGDGDGGGDERGTGAGGGKRAGAGDKGRTKGAAQRPPAPARARAPAPCVHFGCGAPCEALFEGFFMELPAARQYVALFSSSEADAGGSSPNAGGVAGGGGGSTATDPYARACLEANAARLADLAEADLRRGRTLDALRRALLLVLLQDPAPAAPGPLAPAALVPLEELLAPSRRHHHHHRPAAQQQHQQQQQQRDMLLSAAPSLVRALSSGAAVIAGVARELEAVRVAARLWPARRLLLAEQARAEAEAGAAAGGSSGGEDALGGGGTAAARLAWAEGFCMEARLLEQLAELAPRVRSCAGGGVFSGISACVDELLARLPSEAPALLPPAGGDAASAAVDACAAAALAAAEPVAAALQGLLEAAELSLADGLLDRCRDAAWALQRLGVRLADAVAARAAAAAAADETAAETATASSSSAAAAAAAAPEWVLDVRAATDAQVRSGGLPARAAPEGVLLQYAVDAKLDALLAALFLEFTAPPLTAAPFPRLVRMLRAQAARLDLWRVRWWAVRVWEGGKGVHHAR